MPNRELIIEAGCTERQYWKDLWNYRELFYFLAWRDILVWYKQTVIGILWALIRPFRPARLNRCCIRRRHGSRTVDFCAERQIPGFPLKGEGLYPVPWK